MSICVYSSQYFKVGTIMNSISKIRKLRPREVKSLAQGLSNQQWQGFIEQTFWFEIVLLMTTLVFTACSLGEKIKWPLQT